MTGPDLEARAAILDLNARVAWALDLQDWDQLRDALAAEVHYVSVGRDVRGAEEVVASFRARGEERTTRHGLGNLLVREAPGETVLGHSSWYTFASSGTDHHPGVPRRVPQFLGSKLV